MIVRALELLDSHAVAVIVVSPLGVEHGPLPASVRGVISGIIIRFSASYRQSIETFKSLMLYLLY